MLLAAGRGERLRPLTDTQPKALIEVAGRSLIERHLDGMAAAGVEVVVINLGWLGERIVERVGSGSAHGLQVVYSPEDGQVLETGGGIRRALPLLGREPFWVVNADIVTDMVLTPPVLPDDALGELVLVPTPGDREQGDFDLAGTRVTNASRPRWTFSGIACYRPEFLADCRPGRFPLAPLLRAAAARGELAGRLYQGLWGDAGTLQRLQALERRLLEG
ncbi:MAG TPA: nucleotidyltransferase family protein [Woeseiaceae bacterium]|nr:nucleotidyltransferase family protein [Woeseiaceae bacterium]